MGNAKAARGGRGEPKGFQVPTSQRNFSWPGKRKWRSIALMLALMISATFVAGYILLSLTVNSPSPAQNPGRGWAALIQPASESQADQVSLQVLVGGGGRAMINVSACGPRPYNGELLLSNVIDNPSALNEYMSGNIFSGGGEATGWPVHLRNFTQWYSGYVDTYQFRSYGQVQDISVRFPHVLSCSSSQQIAHSQLAVSGFTPFLWWQSASGPLGLWRGPHASLSAPLIGALPLASASGPFATTGGLTGKWALPSRINVYVEALTPDTWSIDSSEPTLASSLDSSGSPAWSSQSAVSPTAQFTDVPSVASLEDWTVLFAVGFGIGSGLVASLILEFLRPEPSRNANKPPGKEQCQRDSSSLQRSSHPSHSRLAAIGLVFAIYCILRRRLRT
jgi:hypothetical protein